MRCRRLIVAVLAIGITGSAWGAETGLMVGVHHTMNAYLLSPDGPGPYPGMLVLESSRGVNGPDIAFARALVQQGYVCLIPHYLEAYNDTSGGRYTSFTNDADAIYADLVSAAGSLAQTPQVHGSKIGAVGFSNGGLFAVWLAATHQVAAAVSYYGAVTGAGTDHDLTRFKPLFTASSAPLMLFVGSKDTYFRPTHRLIRILQDAGSPFQVQFYEDAHHEFDRPGLNDADHAAAADAWSRTMSFLAHNLKGQ
jgi:carboxymethylenebutenolidase